MKFEDLPKTYPELIALEAPRVIETEEHYKRVWPIIEAMSGFEDQSTDDQKDYLETLCILVNEWELKKDEIQYPTRCQIIDATGMEVFPGVEGRTPDESKPHVGKEGLAEKHEGTVKITLDDGSILYGHECWWVPLDSPAPA
jgi:hypothetical protein